VTIHAPRRGTTKSWMLILVLVALTLAAVATGYFGLRRHPDF
jgi:hypothetical protein